MSVVRWHFDQKFFRRPLARLPRFTGVERSMHLHSMFIVVHRVHMAPAKQDCSEATDEPCAEDRKSVV